MLTRSNPALATRIYALLGFEPTEPLQWPAQWAAARISNPDAPHHRHLMWLSEGERRIAVMPVLVARRLSLEPGESFFSVLDVRLVAVQPGRPGQPTRVLERDGQPLWQPAYAVAPYLERMGGNTGYVFHPEETAADNFSYLVSGRKVPNPELLRRLRAVLQSGNPLPAKSPP